MQIRVSVRLEEVRFLIDLMKTELVMKYDFVTNPFDKNMLIVKNEKAVARIRTYDDPETGKVNVFIDVTDKKLYEQLITIIKEAPLRDGKL